jgi:hypothetical protein
MPTSASSASVEVPGKAERRLRHLHGLLPPAPAPALLLLRVALDNKTTFELPAAPGSQLLQGQKTRSWLPLPPFRRGQRPLERRGATSAATASASASARIARVDILVCERPTTAMIEYRKYWVEAEHDSN